MLSSIKEYIKFTGSHIKVRLQILLYEEEDTVIAYCPALELTTYGDKDENIIKLFEENLNIFFEETLRSKTLEHELIMLNWKLIPNLYSPQKIEHKISKFQEGNDVKQEIFEERIDNPLCLV